MLFDEMRFTMPSKSRGWDISVCAHVRILFWYLGNRLTRYAEIGCAVSGHLLVICALQLARVTHIALAHLHNVFRHI